MVWVSAVAVLSAFKTDEQSPGVGELIEFNDVVTQVGATTNFTGTTFTCPSTSIYFVHYRLIVKATADTEECRVELVVGGATREVGIFLCGKTKTILLYKCSSMPAARQPKNIFLSLNVLFWQGATVSGTVGFQVSEVVILQCLQGDTVFLQSASNSCVVTEFGQATLAVTVVA